MARCWASTSIVTSSRTGEGVDELHALGARQPHARAHRRVGSREVDARQPARRRRRAGDGSGARGRPARPPHHDRTRAGPAARAAVCWSTRRGCARCRCGTPTRASAAPSPTSRRSRRSAASTTARTVEPGCAVRAAIESGELDADRFEHYRRLDAELDAAERKRQARILSKAQKEALSRDPERRDRGGDAVGDARQREELAALAPAERMTVRGRRAAPRRSSASGATARSSGPASPAATAGDAAVPAASASSTDAEGAPSPAGRDRAASLATPSPSRP